MRHIKLSTKPIELSEEVQEDLTRIFLDNHNKRVWNQPYIKTALLEMTHHKCAYSEVVLGESTILSGLSDFLTDHFSLYFFKICCNVSKK